jgi:putative DNA primase/helicase
MPIAAIGNRDLEYAGANLVHRLGGTWHGSFGMCRCPAHADRIPSLSVRVGRSRLLLKCFAGCDRRDVLRAIRRLEPKSLEVTGSRASPNAGLDQWLKMRARELWSGSRSIGGSLAEAYLHNRLIDTCSASLRFNNRTPLGKKSAAIFRPALIAAVTDDSGLLAVQRTFLDARGRRARDLKEPRRLLGRPRAGAVRLTAATDTLGLAEGVETAISAMILLGIPVWATLGSERFPHVAIPRSVTRLLLLPDNDAAGYLAVPLAMEAHAMPGRHIDTDWPWHGLNDWNDTLRMERGGGSGGRRQVV